MFSKERASNKSKMMLFSDYFILDNDEPLLSGTGIVSKDVTDENLLESWAESLGKWHQNLKQRPRQVTQLCRRGVPEALRGEVWQLLSGCDDNNDMLETYRVLIAKVYLLVGVKYDLTVFHLGDSSLLLILLSQIHRSKQAQLSIKAGV